MKKATFAVNNSGMNMKKSFSIAILTALTAAGCSTGNPHSDNQNLKPRLVVLTDIGPADVEPDDNESAVRLMCYADRFEIEAICTTVGYNCDPYPSEWAAYLDNVVEAYKLDVENLMKRSKQKEFLSEELEQNQPQELGYWPSAEYLSSRCLMGSQRAGIGVVGQGNDSPGSDFLIKLALEDDPRPIWVTAWGSANTLAQAIWRYKQTATPAELKKFVNKFRVYTITDQDMIWAMRENLDYSSHMWMRQEFKDDLFCIWDESAWKNHNSLGVSNWPKHEELIQSMGYLGYVYPHYLWGVEGDTPSFLHIMPNGLNDPEDPTQAGWGGYHTYGISPDQRTYAWTNWQQPELDASSHYEHIFYMDSFNDFAARMEWAQKGAGNRNPIAVVNGISGLSQIHIKAKAGEPLEISAKGSADPDGDIITYTWIQQVEAGTYNKPITIENENSATPGIVIPSDAKGKTIHLILAIRDRGAISLAAYRRIIVTVK